MKHFKLVLFLLLSQYYVGQTYFNNYYKTGYNNLLSSNVLTTDDSGYVFVNYISDSVTHRQDFGLIKIDKSGNEVNKKSFNMFDQDYSAFLQGMKQFIPATNCSYFLTGGTYDINDHTAILLNKINRLSLDTMITKSYRDSVYNMNMNNFIKFNDNKYFLIGDKGNSLTSWPFILELDSSLNVITEINVYNPNNFSLSNAVYNPNNKQILLAGITTIPGAGDNQPVMLMHIDTLGNPINAVTVVTPIYGYGMAQLFYSAFDNTYVIVGGKPVVAYGGPNGMQLSRLMISKFNATTLNPIWQKTYGEEALINACGDAVILSDGSIVASAGYSPLTTLPLMNEDVGGGILKVDKDGNLQWFREYNNLVTGTDSHLYWEVFYGIDTTREGGYILCGSVMNQPKAKAWAVKTDGNGCVTPGCTSSSVSVENFSTTTQTVDVTAPPTSTTGISTTVFNAASISVYPNPATDIVNVTYTLSESIDLKITDVCGQELKKARLSQANKIDIKELHAGIYFFNLYSKNHLVKTCKIIKE